MSEPRDSVRAEARESNLLVETSLVIGIGLGALLLGTLALTVLLSSSGEPEATLPFIAGSLGWRSVIWALGTIAIAVLLRRRSRTLRMRLSLVMAVVAVTAATLINLGPDILFAGMAFEYASVTWFFEVVVFGVCALLGWLLAIRLLDTPRDRWPLTVLPIITTLLIALGGAGIVGLFLQWFGLYFRLWSTETYVYEDFGPEGIRYLVTAGSAVAVLIVAIVLAALRRARGLAALASVLLALCLMAAFVFQVPTGRFIPKPVTYELPDDYTPCYGGEGDPGCEGG